MRLLFVIDSLCAGGAQRQLTSLALELKHRGHDVDVFVYHDIDHFGDELRCAGVTILLHRKPSRFSLRPIRQLREIFRRAAYDVVLSYLPVPNAYSLCAAAGLSSRPKIVVSERSFPRAGRAGIKKRMLEKLYRRADGITTNSHHMREYYRRQYGWNDDRVTTIWNGLDLGRFPTTPLLRTDNEPLRLLCIGRVDRDKNWCLLVEAMARLRDDDGLGTQVSLVGRDRPVTADEHKYRDELDALIRRHGLQDAWTYLGPRSDIAQLFATHHALAHPSTVEGMSNVVCESLACGRPAIVADAFDHRRLVQHGETGWLFESGSAARLADALRKLRGLNSDELAAMGAKARRFAEQNLTVDRLADEYEALFKSLVGPHRRPEGASDRI